jgi:hypothetical protein
MAAPGVLHWGYPQGNAKGAANRTATCLLATFRPGVSSATLLFVTARDSDRDVWRPSSRGLFESSIYPVEHSVGALKVGSTDLGARRVGPPMRRDFLHKRGADAPHALSRGPEGADHPEVRPAGARM